MHAHRATVIAHRGASAYAPEHTFAAYDLALAQGADVLELDVRQTADGRPVVLHDATLLRTAGDPRPVAAVGAGALAALPGAPLPLAAVLERYAGRAGLLVEVKACEPAVLLAALAGAGARDAVTVQAFDHRFLRRLRALDPGLPLAALFRPWRGAAAVRRELARVGGCAGAVGPSARHVDAPLVLAAHARGIAVRPYTVNDEAEAERLLALGVDGLITDVPDRIRAVVDAVPAAALAA
jgi:glycerophosphoryl diester phosphodiesterase